MTLLSDIAILTAVVILQPPQLTSPTDTEEAQRLKQALHVTKDWAARYEFQTKDGGNVELQADPILRWSNPEQGSVHGNVFLWTQNKRPVVIGSLFQWFSPHTHMSHEFHSLSEHPMSAVRTERVVWQSPAGVEFQPVSAPSQVSNTTTGRNLQMRQIVRRLSVQKRERSQTDLKELRLLTTPIYRYETTEQASASGALFAFVQGTDPEVIVWLEARDAKNGKQQWHVSFARMNGIELRVTQQGAELWRAEEMPWGDISAHRKPYTSYTSRRHPIK